ncbi:MAG: hypothetical protein K2Y22_15895 [Candidatus Obscuribacterales bacterium]|nr:hypothetical protein [Candidatus Obscuribacterales bacterium]
MSRDWLDFKECVEVSRKIVHASLDCHMIFSFEALIKSEFEKIIKDLSSNNQGADTARDNYSDCMWLLRDALHFCTMIKEYWSDSHHYSQPMRWLKFTNELALQGKTQSALVVTNNSYDKSGEKTIRRIDCELHQDKRDSEIRCHTTSFSLSAYHLQDRTWSIRHEDVTSPDNNVFYAFVFPGLEAMGFATPTLDTWNGSWSTSSK